MMGSMLHNLKSSCPSTLEIFPQKTAKPFSGVFLNSFKCLTIFSNASVTFFLVEVVFELKQLHILQKYKRLLILSASRDSFPILQQFLGVHPWLISSCFK